MATSKLHTWQKMKTSIRNANRSDLDKLLTLDEECWEEYLRTSESMIIQRIEIYPEGQFVAILDDEVIGVVYTQIILDSSQLLSIETNYSNQNRLHCYNGKIVQLLSISVSKTVKSNIGEVLRDYVLNKAFSDNNIVEVVAMIRCSQYKTNELISLNNSDYSEYIMSMKDPTLLFHKSGGAEIVQIVHNYRVEDVENFGKAILIRYKPPYKNHAADEQKVKWIVSAKGIGFKLPGISSISSLCEVLQSGRTTSSIAPIDRFDVDGFISRNLDSCGDKKFDRIRFGSFLNLNQINSSSLQHFNITSREEDLMSIAQKLLLQVSHEAIVDSGYSLSDLKSKKVGVFISALGFGPSTSYLRAEFDMFEPSFYNNYTRPLSSFQATGNSLSVLSGRISFAFGFEGPCVTLDTASSASLTALHFARTSLELNECEVALVGAINIIDLRNSAEFAAAGMLSADGLSHTFDSSANGYVRGEGCIVYLLERRSAEISKISDFYFEIVGSTVRQDGNRASLTTPNGKSQVKLITDALRSANLEANQVMLIESHGSGTPLGDPIEMEAIAEAYCKDRTTLNWLIVCGAKANFGHLEAAAGSLGTLVASLSLQMNIAPKVANLVTINPKVEAVIKNKRITLPMQNTPLINDTCNNRDLMYAGVNSFGFSGSIAHVIIASSQLHRKYHSKSMTPTEESALEPIVFQFSGQGTLRLNIGIELYNHCLTFRKAFLQCQDLIHQFTGINITDVLYPAISGRYGDEEAERLLVDTRYSQPILVSYQFSLSQVYLSEGYQPSALIGHSLGEYCAAILAGVFSLDDCLMIVCDRANLIHEYSGCQGSMYVVKIGIAEVLNCLETVQLINQVSIAAHNSDDNLVVSGSDVAISLVLRNLPAGTKTHRLSMRHAFHSPLMAGIVDRFRKVLSKVEFCAPKMTVIPTIRSINKTKDGQIGDGILNHGVFGDMNYWCSHLLTTVQYKAAMEECFHNGVSNFLEIGPDSTLTNLLCSQRWMRSISHTKGNLIPHTKQLVKNFVRCGAGSQIVMDNDRLRTATLKSKISCLRYFHEAKFDPIRKSFLYTTYIHNGNPFNWIQHYRVMDTTVFPNAAFISWTFGAVLKSRIDQSVTWNDSDTITIESTSFSKPLQLTEAIVTSSPVARWRSIYCEVNPSKSVSILSTIDRDEPLINHTISTISNEGSSTKSDQIAELRSVFRTNVQNETVDMHLFYQRIRRMGLSHGESCCLIRSAKRLVHNSVTYIESVIDISNLTTLKCFLLHPCIIEAIFQSALVDCDSALPMLLASVDKMSVIISKAFDMYEEKSLRSVVQIVQNSSHRIVFDCVLLNSASEVLFWAEGMCLQVLSQLEASNIQHSVDSSCNMQTLTVTEEASGRMDLESRINRIVLEMTGHSEKLSEDESILNRLDSLSILELANLLSSQLSIKISPSTLMTQSTLRGIRTHIMKHCLPDDIQEVSLSSQSSTTRSDSVTRFESPWFLKYSPPPSTTLSGLGQPSITWHSFATLFNEQGFEVLIVQQPGRYERLSEKPIVDIHACVQELCKTILQLEGQCGPAPMVLLGYSFGVSMAYECARYLEHECVHPVQHLICIAGPSREKFKTWKFLDENEKNLQAFCENMIENFGRINPQMDKNFKDLPEHIIAGFFEIFQLDSRLGLAWATAFDDLSADMKLVSCDITSINPRDDIAVDVSGWKPYTKGRYQEIVFKGDHFFILQSIESDREVALECSHILRRSL